MERCSAASSAAHGSEASDPALDLIALSSQINDLQAPDPALGLIALSSQINGLQGPKPSSAEKKGGVMGSIVKKLSFERKPRQRQSDGRASCSSCSAPRTDSSEGALDLIALSTQINSLQQAGPSSGDKKVGVMGTLVKKLSFERKPRPAKTPQATTEEAPSTATHKPRRFSFTKQPKAAESTAQVPVAVEGSPTSAIGMITRKLSFSKQKKEARGSGGGPDESPRSPRLSVTDFEQLVASSGAPPPPPPPT